MNPRTWSRKRLLTACCAALLLVLAAVAVASFFLGDKRALDSLTIRRVAPGQLAAAMAGDHFYSDYRESTLLVAGTAASITRSGRTAVVTFATRSSFKTRYEFATDTGGIRPGARVVAVSEGALAKRQASAVVLRNCTTP